MRRVSLIETLFQDLRYALRQLGKNPGFAAVAILTLALGIGANTAIFSMIEKVMLRMMPVRQPEQLVELLTQGETGRPFPSFSFQALQYFRENTRLCSGIIAMSDVGLHALIEGTSWERLRGQFVTGDYFDVLGVGTVQGRPLTLTDDQTGLANAVAVISHSVWKSSFGGRSDAIGRPLTIENVPFTIVGVAPPSFSGLAIGREVDVWVPLAMEPRLRQPSRTASSANKWLQLIGRLKPGVSIDEARAELRVLFNQAVIEAEPPGSNARQIVKSWSLAMRSAKTGRSDVRQQFSGPLLVLMAIVGIVLLIACTNVANLLFARALAREKEIALRLSLGAGRARVIRQLLTESAVLATAGGVLGLLLAYLTSGYLAGFLSTGRLPLALGVTPNVRTLGFAAAVAACTVILFGLMPAFRSTDMDFASRLKGPAMNRGDSQRHPLRAGLIVIQVALLTVLTLGAGLFVRSLHNLKSIDLGFDSNNVLLLTLDPFGSAHTPEQLQKLYVQLIERIEGLPGVQTASLSMVMPVDGGGTMLTFAIEDSDVGRRLARNVYVNRVSPKYFATVGTSILDGRDFSPRDSITTPRVAIVNQSFAQQYFGRLTPIGKTISLNNDRMEIIGVAGDAKYMEIREAMHPTVYLNTFQQATSPSQFLVRAERDPLSIAAAIRAEARSLIGNVAIRERTLEQQIDASIVQERLVGTLAGIFGALSIVLAVIGLYGVVSSSVAGRTKEIGVRIALGIEPRKVVLMVLREVLVLVGAGIAVGLPLAYFITRSIGSLLYGLAPDDPLTMLIAVGSLLLAALTAGFLPARRASRVDPMAALRCE